MLSQSSNLLYEHENTADDRVLEQAREIDAEGNPYWQIETEKDIFKDIETVKGLQKAAYEYILHGYKGSKIVGLIDGENIEFIRISAKEYVYGNASKTLSTSQYKQKMRMSVSIMDLIENAPISYDAPDHKNHKMFPNGFKNYQGRVGIDETIFRYIVRVGKAKNGMIFYDINLEVDGRVPHAKSTSPIKSSTSNNSIRNSDRNVNTNFSDRDTEYLELAKEPIKNDAKLSEMVEEKAKESGFPIKVYHGTTKFGFTKTDVRKSDDGISFFATDSLDLAQTYSGALGETSIKKGTKQNTDNEQIYNDKLDAFVNKVNSVAGKEFLKADQLPFGEYANKIKKGKMNAGQLWSEMVNYTFDVLEKIEADKKISIEDNNSIWKLSTELETALYGLNGDAGNYGLYANTDGFLEIEGNGARWSSIPFDKIPSKNTANTREIVKWAKDNGFTGVLFKNIYDIGNHGNTQKTPANVYAFLNPKEQLKSADPVTYNAFGRVIPLSQRFNSSKDDIRYSDREGAQKNINSKGVLNNVKNSGTIEVKGNIEFDDEFDSIFNEAISKVAIAKVSMKVFPPYNKSHSDANEQATRWAHNESVEIGAQTIAFYKNGSYVIEKFDSTELKYLIIGRINYDDYRNIRRELEANAKSRKEESIEELATVYDKRNRQGDTTQRRGQSSDSVAIEHREQSDTIQRVDKNQDSEQKVHSYPDRSDERNGTNKQSESLEGDIHYSERDDTSVYDTMGETERIKKENKKFKADIERLKERLKIERQVTHGNYFNENQLGTVAGHLRKISNSGINKARLIDRLKDVYSFIAQSENLTWQDVFERCYRI